MSNIYTVEWLRSLNRRSVAIPSDNWVAFLSRPNFIQKEYGLFLHETQRQDDSYSKDAFLSYMLRWLENRASSRRSQEAPLLDYLIEEIKVLQMNPNDLHPIDPNIP